MKYKVLKEFISPAGSLVEPGSQPIDDLSYPMMTEALLRNGFIEEIKDEPWEPVTDEYYYYISTLADETYGEDAWKPVDWGRWVDEGVDKFNLSIGNCFQAEKQAEKAAEWLKAFKVLRDDTKGFKPERLGDGYTVWYDAVDKELRCGWNTIGVNTIIYFATEADAKESIKNHENLWKIFLGIEEEE